MTPTSPGLFTDPTHLTNLKREAKTESDDNLREVARQFEALFTHMLLKNMRAASFGDGAFENDQSKLYQDMFDQQMSTELSNGSGLGIADMLVRQLGGAKSVQPAQNTDMPLVMPERPAAAVPAPVAVSDKHQERGPAQFVSDLLPHARRVADALGVAPKFILAQAALETGWGSRPIRNADGSDSNNVFGIKAGSSWQGPRAVVDTLEFAAGVGNRLKAAFRSYTSLAESFDDYAALLRDSPRYGDALQTGDDGEAFAGALARGGYATDPDYADKITGIADGPTLQNVLSVLKMR